MLNQIGNVNTHKHTLHTTHYRGHLNSTGLNISKYINHRLLAILIEKRERRKIKTPMKTENESKIEMIIKNKSKKAKNLH